jgi:cell wall-associated NlpC family hydrolase
LILLTSIRSGLRKLLIALAALAPLATGARAQSVEWTLPEPPPTAVSAAAAGADLALQALTFVGVPYRFGGDDPARGFDCSGLVRHVARSVLGVELPRSAEAIARVGQRIDDAALQGGDLVFFNTRGRRYSHVGVYIGDGRFVHAPARNGLVRVEAIADRYWRSRFNGARRLLSPPSAATAPDVRSTVPDAARSPKEVPVGSNPGGGA